MRSLLSLLSLTMVLTGCDSTPPPAKLPAGATVEVFTIAAAIGPNTTEAVDPRTGAPLFLQSPPIVTTTDIDTVAIPVTNSVAVGSWSERVIPALDIKLTAQGAAKMSATTATPTGKPIAFVINGKVISTPDLNSPIRGSFQISGDPNDPNFKSAVDVLTKR